MTGLIFNASEVEKDMNGIELTEAILNQDNSVPAKNENISISIADIQSVTGDSFLIYLNSKRL